MTYKILLTLIWGRDLAVKDKTTSDPYVIIKHNNKENNSKIINCTLNPNWFETFDLEVNQNDLIEFHCWDKDMVGSDDKMGISIWRVPELIENQIEYFVLDNNMQGQISISVLCTSGGKQSQILEIRDNKLFQVLRVDVESVGNVEEAIKMVGLAKFERCILWFKGMFTESVCSITKLISNEKTENNEQTKSSNCFITTIQDIEHIDIELFASENVKYPEDILITSGRMNIKLMKENDELIQIVKMKNDVCLHLKIECVRSVWTNVNQQVIDAYSKKL